VNIRQIIARKAIKKAKKKDNARFIAKVAGKKLKPTRTAVRKQLWDATSLIVRMRDRRIADGRCLICRARPIECAYHIEPQQCGDSVRYDLNNVIGACHGCNWGEKNNRRQYQDKHVALFGADRIAALKAKAALTVHLTTAELIALRNERRQILASGFFSALPVTVSRRENDENVKETK
jgi:5-methylcytosine-specific restriction endonuclease McrA